MKRSQESSRNIRSSRFVKCLLLAVILILVALVYLLLFHNEEILLVQKQQFRLNILSNRPSILKNSKPKIKQPVQWMNRDGAEKYNYYGDGSCSTNKDRGNYIFLMQKWLEIAEKHNIEYFLSFGSLLGSWRDEEVIPWDGDLDLHMKVDDFVHIEKLRDTEDFDTDDGKFHIYVTKDWSKPIKMRRRHNCDGEQVDSYSGQCSFIEPFARFIRHGDHLDLYVYTTYYDTLKFLPDDGDEFLKSDIFPLTRCKYMGLEFRCPRNAKAVLDIIYNRKLIPRDLCLNGTFLRNEIAYMDPKELEQEMKRKREEEHHEKEDKHHGDDDKSK